MDWVKKNWILLVCGLLAVAGIGIGVWSLMGFQEVQAQANTIAGIATQLQGMASNPRDAANERMIQAAKAWWDRNNADTVKARDAAVTINKRTPLRDDVFPSEQKPDSGYLFRIAYREEMRKLPEIINGGKAPDGATVQAIISRMEDKARKEANLTGAGGELRVPRPPQVLPWQPPVAAVRQTSPMGPYGAGMGDMRPGNAVDMRPDSMVDIRPSSPVDIRPSSPVDMRPGAGWARPGSTRLVQQPSHLPLEQMREDAQNLAVYQTAKSLWTYVGDDSFDMHPIGLPSSVEKPRIEDLWAAQVSLWVEQDVAQALRQTNEEAIRDRNIPVEDRWVANLPVKHLVWLRVSDYLIAQSESRGGYSGPPMRRGVGSTMMTGGLQFGDQAIAFTDRTRTDDYDVVHFAMNVVVDARDLPRLLLALCRQNFITPIQVQYRAVDSAAAAKSGYLYGAAPVLNVDIVCEALFFRSNYEPMMPQIVKDRLEGKAVGGMGMARY